MTDATDTHTIDHLMQRVRGEYQEMPGLRLTLEQASWLWQLTPSLCRILLGRLTAERVLRRTKDGAYVAGPGRGRPRRRQAPAVERRHPVRPAISTAR